MRGFLELKNSTLREIRVIDPLLKTQLTLSPFTRKEANKNVVTLFHLDHEIIFNVLNMIKLSGSNYLDRII